MFFISLKMALLNKHTLREWFDIVDLLLGLNCKKQNIALAIKMAGESKHPDASWLFDVCNGKNVTSEKDVARIFTTHVKTDARAMCFLWCLSSYTEQLDLTLLLQSATLGFAFAQACLAGQLLGLEQFKFAKLAADQGERNGLYWLGLCHVETGRKEEAKKYYLMASEFGDVLSMIRLGNFFNDTDPRHWKWWGKAAQLGCDSFFLDNFVERVKRPSSNVVLFAIGQTLHGHVDDNAETVFNRDYRHHSLFMYAKRVIAFYKKQVKATKAAMHAWTQVGIRWKVVKDIRKVIGMLIWQTREEALY